MRSLKCSQDLLKSPNVQAWFALAHKHGLRLWTRWHITFSFFCDVVQMLQWHFVYGINILKNLFLYRLSHSLVFGHVDTCTNMYLYIFPENGFCSFNDC